MSLVQRALLLCVFCALGACASGGGGESATGPVWSAGADVEDFWAAYAESRGGLTFGSSDTYPPYGDVEEGDTLLIQLEQGPCLMEFFHSRWRRANDVRRWDDSVNEYGGCPYVFD